METFVLTPKKNVDAGTRLGSMILDHFLMTLIAFIFMMPMMISGFISAMDASHDTPEFQALTNPSMYLFLFGFAIYFCKDCIQGRSLAKRILKLQVLNNKTGDVASPLRCFIRNLFCIIWPIEVIVALSNPSRRIGDFVAGTRVEYYDPYNVPQPKAFTSKLIPPIILAWAICCTPMIITQSIAFAPKAKYVENSYNYTESKQLEALFADSLGSELTADVRVYDKVEKEDVKYVSIIFRLKQNYLEDDGTRKQLTDLCKNLLYAKYPKNTITGHAKYIYEEPGHFQSTSHDIGRDVGQGK